MRSRLSPRFILFFATGLIALAQPLLISAQSIRFNSPYTCNKERIVVFRCRKDSDMPGFPPTRPDQDYCHVEYPDRPLRGGLIQFASVLRSELIQQLQACGAFAPALVNDSGSRSSVDESVAVFNVGDKYYKAGNYAKALEYFKESNSIAVSSAATIMTGISQYQLKMFPDAIVSLKETIRMVPNNPEAHYWLGSAYKDLGTSAKDEKQYSLAESEFRTAIRLKPDYKSAYGWLGAVLYLQHKFPEAVNAFQESLRLDPNSGFSKYLLGATYARMGQKDNAMQIYRELAISDPKSAADLLAEINKPAFVKASPPAAGTAEYFLAQGNKHRDAKEYQLAIEQYRKSIALKPDLTLAQLNLGFVYFQLEDFPSALAPLKKAAMLDPNDDDNQFWLGVTYYKLKQYPLAMATLKEAIRLDPKSPYSHYNLGETYLYGTKDYAKAQPEYLEAVRLKPDYDLAHNQLGLAYLWQGQFADALKSFQTAFRLNGTSPEASPTYLENIGIAQVRLGKKTEAMEIYRTLQKTDAAKAKELLDVINEPTAAVPKPTNGRSKAAPKASGPASRSARPSNLPPGVS